MVLRIIPAQAEWSVFVYNEVKMAKNEEKGEIVLYQPEGEVRLEVRVENETVWLNRQQMALLFNRDIKTIGKHITNALKEELKDLATVANFATVQKEGVRSVSRMIEHYNLDMILSIGYRVKSANGIKFRRWASQVLKGYMLKGYAVNQRKIAMDLQIADRLHEQRQLIESQGAEIADVRKSIAEQDSRLSAVEQRIDFFVNAVVYSARITPEFRAAADLHKKQYPGLDLKTMRTIHDRFLLVDDKVYHFGASFKDMGNEMTAFSVLDFVTPAEVIEKIQESMKGR